MRRLQVIVSERPLYPTHLLPPLYILQQHHFFRIMAPKVYSKMPTFNVHKMYPKSHHNRTSGTEPSVQPMRRAFLKAAMINFSMLQILFLCLFAYIFGSLFQQTGHTHNLNVLYVDYDGRAVGQSIRDAYTSLQANSFPSLQEMSTTQYPSPEDLETAVCKTRYWAALYTSPGSSTRLEAALANESAASTYNRSNVLTFIWNEARYSTTIDTAIANNLQTLSSAARLAYTSTNGTSALQLVTNSGGPGSIPVFANPWVLTSIDLQPTTQGSRAIYNTLVIILIIIQEFFYLGTINGLYVSFKMYTRFYPHRIIFYRNLISLAYTFIGSLCTTGAIWAFRASWNVNGVQFVLSWIVLWLFAHSNFLWFDVFTIWLPVQYVPMSLITWMVFNVSSILLPFELSPGFYRWAYAMPAHEVYQTLTDIWSRGCNPQLYYALPILFTLEVIGLALSALGVYRRCHYATIAEENQESAFQKRVSDAVEFERKRDRERKSMEVQETQRSEESREEIEGQEEGEERKNMEDLVRREDELERERTKAEGKCNFGPSFDVGYRENS